MRTADEKFAITFNGEIYNSPELRANLERSGAVFRSSSDTEVLLHLYAQRGPAMLNDLRGMFAFAIWDAAKEGLLLARDPFGMKPLYRADDGRTFRFASQVKALLAGGSLRPSIDAAGLVGLHLYGSVPDPFTLYRDIQALPAGHSQWIDADGPQDPVSYYSVAAEFAKRHKDSDDEQLNASVRRVMMESLRAHLLADVEVGMFLSGGIDSGALLGLMHNVGGAGVRAVTLGFEEFFGTPEDEVPIAAKVARQYGANHLVRRVGEREFTEDLPKIFAAMDQPSIDGINTWFVSKAAGEAGLKVALSGLGSDELFGGYPSFQDIPRWKRGFGRFAAVPGLGRAFRTTMRLAFPRVAVTNPKVLGLIDYSGTWGGAYLLRRGLFLPDELPGVMDPEIARSGLERLRPIQQLHAALVPDPGSDAARVSTLETSFYMRNQLLRDADWAGMAHGLEIRLPFVDTAVVAALAGNITRIRKNQGKQALAQAPEPPLPGYVTERNKTGFGVPTDRWIDSELQPRSTARKGLVSRRWLKFVLHAALNNS